MFVGLNDKSILSFLHHTSPNMLQVSLTLYKYIGDKKWFIWFPLWCTFSWYFSISMNACMSIVICAVFGGGCIAKKHVKWSCHGILCCKILCTVHKRNVFATCTIFKSINCMQICIFWDRDWEQFLKVKFRKFVF